MRKKTVVIVHDMEQQMFIDISDYRAAAMYSETEVQVFPKQMKQLTTVQNVITEKQ
jgi:hypothetical protein